MYDSLLVVALLFLSTLPFVIARGGQEVAPGDPLYRFTMLFVIYLFFVIFWSRYGRTLGMQAWGLRVETAGGEQPGLKQASLRFFCAILSLMPFGLGFFWQLVDADNLAWHDRLSGTRLRYYPRDRG